MSYWTDHLQNTITGMKLKFRFWDISLKRYIKDSSFLVLPFNDEMYICEQYVGIDDVNGNEIYSGDIVRLFRENITDGIYVIKYFPQTMQFVFDSTVEPRKYYQDHSAPNVANKLFNTSVEILGNIHTDNNLLK